MSYERNRRLLARGGLSNSQWHFEGNCYHCAASCYRDDDNERTKWDGGDPYCLHELPTSVNRINRDEEEED